MGEKEGNGFRKFLEGKGVDVSPEYKPKRRISLRDSVRRLREMNLGLAAFAAALLAAGAAVWKIEFPAFDRPPSASSAGPGSSVVQMVFDSSPAPKPARRPARVPPKAEAVPPARNTAPERGPVYHVVRPGDTLIGIAKKYYGKGWKWTEIARANPQAAGDSWKLKVGAKLAIPAIEKQSVLAQKTEEAKPRSGAAIRRAASPPRRGEDIR